MSLIYRHVEIDGIIHDRKPHEGGVTRCRIPFVTSGREHPGPFCGWKTGTLLTGADTNCMTCLVFAARFTR